MFNRITLLVMLVTNTGAALGQGDRPNRPQKPEIPLQLTVRIDRQTYHLSDNMGMETQITNVGNEDVYLYDMSLCYNFARGLVIEVYDSTGKYVHSDFLIDCVPPPPAPENIYAFVKIMPGTFYGISEHSPVRELANKPGEYDIKVTYQSCLSAGWIDQYFSKAPISKLPLWTVEKPILTANQVHFSIVP